MAKDRETEEPTLGAEKGIAAAKTADGYSRRGLGTYRNGSASLPAGILQTTEAGRDALGWYHERKSNDDRNVGLGPNHDWSSHAADGFGLMCIHYDQPDGAPPPRERYRRRGSSSGGGSGQSA
jgi:hypothetical protein